MTDEAAIPGAPETPPPQHPPGSRAETEARVFSEEARKKTYGNLVEQAKGLHQIILDKEWVLFLKELERAREAYLVAFGSNPRSITLEILNALDGIEKQLRDQEWPRRRQRTLQTFLQTYQSLVQQFPDIVDQAKDDGYREGREDGERFA